MPVIDLPERASEASEHHDELRFTITRPSGSCCDPLNIFKQKELCRAVEAALGGKHPIAALYFPDDGALLARIQKTDVAFLHELRDSVLEGKFANQLFAELSTLGSSTDFEVTVDLTDFAERYEQSVLHLDKLTRHQSVKLQECDGHQSVRVEAPAGGGKTFLALYLILELLRTDLQARVLFIAPHTALARFAASWIYIRLDDPSIDRDAMLTRVNVLVQPFEQGVQRCRVKDESIEFVPTHGDKPESFGLVVVDEVRRLS